MTKFSGAALWAKKEAHAGDRLPYLSLVDENVALLRDGSLMLSLLVPGISFETADSEELNAHTATREVMLRSALDARFVLYHHVIRRRVHVELDARFDDPLAAHIDACWREKLAAGALFVNDQFVTLVRRPARGKAGWAERLSRMMKQRGQERPEAEPADVRALRSAAAAMVASLGAYGARLLGEYDGASGTCSEVLELLSALYNGEMRPVRRPSEETEIGRMLPYKRLNFGLDALELRGAGGGTFAAMVSLKDYPDSTGPGLTDALLRLPQELVLTETYAPSDRQVARERIDLQRDVALALAELSAATDRAKLARDNAAQDASLANTARILVEVGRDPPLRQLRAEAALAEAQAAEVQTFSAMLAARRTLATLIVSDDPELTAEAMSLPQRGAVEDPELVNIDERLVEAEQRVSAARTTLAQTAATPDVTVSGGLRRFSDGRDSAFVAGISVPIPIRDRNRGGIEAARADAAASQFEVVRVRAEARRDRSQARMLVDAAEARLAALQGPGLAQAEEAARLAQIGYNAGRFSLLELLDAQSALTTARLAIIEARFDRARAEAALARATAQ